MGVYACEKCFEKYDLRESPGVSGYNICEICLALNGDESYKPAVFTWSVNRFGDPMKEQLSEWKLFLLQKNIDTPTQPLKGDSLKEKE